MPAADAALLLTPGPLTTSPATRAAMLRDWGSRDGAFIAMTARVRERLTALAGATGTHTCVPVQGSGTFAVEATLGTLMPRDGRALVLVNGAYGQRMADICRRHGTPVETLDWPEHVPVDAAALQARLAAAPAITHVLAVHCETTTGIVNPLAAIAAACERHGRALLIDAMSSFGNLAIDAGELRFDALMASSNKCLQGVPGLGFAIVRTSVLAASAGRSPSLSLDLHAQWRGLESNGQWRFTPPTHVLAALDQALDELAAEGGVAARHARYRRNCAVLTGRMRALGFEPLLAADHQAPVIVTFHQPRDPAFDFERFYDALAGRGVLIYPGKLTAAPSFRIGCIGHLHESDMHAAVDAVASVLDELQVGQCGRAA